MCENMLKNDVSTPLKNWNHVTQHVRKHVKNDAFYTFLTPFQQQLSQESCSERSVELRSGAARLPRSRPLSPKAPDAEENQFFCFAATPLCPAPSKKEQALKSKGKTLLQSSASTPTASKCSASSSFNQRVRSRPAQPAEGNRNYTEPQCSIPPARVPLKSTETRVSPGSVPQMEHRF